MPLEIELHAVPYLKGLINESIISGQQERGSMESIHQAKVNSGHLLHTVLPRTNQANPVLCTKVRFLNGRYQNLKMLPQPSLQISNLPLIRALK